MLWSAGPAVSQQADTSIANTDIRHVRLHLCVDPAVRYIKGYAEHIFAVDSGALQRPIDLQLADDYIINSISSRGKPLYYYRHHGHIRIYPDTEWGCIDSLSISYCGVPPCTGLGSVMFDKHDNVPVFWTLSEPFGAMDWWPCKQDITDKIDSVTITAECPERYRAASNGVVSAECIKNGVRTTVWKHSYPVCYHLIALAITNYRTYSEWLRLAGGDSLEIVNYVYPEKYDLWRRRTYKLLPAFKMMCDSFGTYPFHNEKYGHAQFGWQGGMEHQTMSFINTPSLNLMIHELAHHWFGNMISCSGWQDVFLHEGFATYCEMLAAEKGVGASSDAVQWRRACISGACGRPSESVRRNASGDACHIFDYGVSYCKGAMMLHMLRREIGDYLFFRLLKSYVSNPLIRYGNTSASDFFGLADKITGRNLEWFFNQWFYGRGYPVYNIKWQQSADELVDILVSQSPADSAAGFFRCKVPLMMHGSNGEKTIFVLNNYYNNQLFTVNPKFTVKHVELDPYRELVTQNGVVERESLDGGRTINIRRHPGMIRINLPDSCNFDWYILRPMRNQGNSLMEMINGMRRIEINTSTIEEGKYILILKGRDYYSTIVNVWNRAARRSKERK